MTPAGKLTGFDDIPTLSTGYQRFTGVRLFVKHLIPSSGTFSSTLTTMAFDHRSLRWFEPPPAGRFEGPTLILRAALHQKKIFNQSHEQPPIAHSWRTVIGINAKIGFPPTPFPKNLFKPQIQDIMHVDI